MRKTFDAKDRRFCSEGEMVIFRQMVDRIADSRESSRLIYIRRFAGREGKAVVDVVLGRLLTLEKVVGPFSIQRSKSEYPPRQTVDVQKDQAPVYLGNDGKVEGF